MIGFCLTEQSDQDIDADGRCVHDGTRTIAPSTGCNHQRWINGAWSICVPIVGEIQRRACKPVAPGTWMNTLGQQARAVAKRDRDRAAQLRRAQKARVAA